MIETCLEERGNGGIKWKTRITRRRWKRKPTFKRFVKTHTSHYNTETLTSRARDWFIIPTSSRLYHFGRPSADSKRKHLGKITNYKLWEFSKLYKFCALYSRKRNQSNLKQVDLRASNCFFLTRVGWLTDRQGHHEMFPKLMFECLRGMVIALTSHLFF